MAPREENISLLCAVVGDTMRRGGSRAAAAVSTNRALGRRRGWHNCQRTSAEGLAIDRPHGEGQRHVREKRRWVTNEALRRRWGRRRTEVQENGLITTKMRSTGSRRRSNQREEAHCGDRTMGELALDWSLYGGGGCIYTHRSISSTLACVSSAHFVRRLR